jgi:outer membrane protein OmpA-like peptidoglycan-associated protein
MSRSPSVAIAVALVAGSLAAAAVAQTPPTAAGPDRTYPVLDLELPVSSLDRSVSRTDSKVTLAADVLFSFNSARLAGRAGSRIDQAATAIRKSHAGTVRIVGYTDDKGSPGFNIGLSRRRARAVEGVLAKAVSGGPKLVASGKGEANPVASNTTKNGGDSPKGRALNRRVEILIPKR